MSAIHDAALKQKNEHLDAIQNILHKKLPDLRQRFGVKSLGILMQGNWLLTAA